MRAAAHLGIPFLTLDLEKEYKKEVVDYMIRAYSLGQVPNPDVMCNKYVKFGAFLDFAQKNGADFIATGHYARITKDEKEYQLLTGADKEKDQSYFLWTLTQKELAHTLFPVGHLQKSEVRALARKFGLPNAEKKDSQGLCFMGPIDMAEFLKHYLKTEKGNVENEHGDVIGTHDGALLYTIGQRHGFFVEKKGANEEPYFVIAKDLVANTITVAHRNSSNITGTRKLVQLGSCNRIGDTLVSIDDVECLARIRYRGELVKVLWGKETDAEIGAAQVFFDRPIEGVASGQSLVAYLGEECLGGGIVLEILV